MLQREESRHDFAFLAGVVVGAIAGAAATLALTPMSGAEAREKLRAQSANLGDIRQRAGEVVGAAQSRAGDVMATAQTRVAPVRERVTELAVRAPLPIRHKEDTVMHEQPGTSGSSPSSRGAHPDEPAGGVANRAAPLTGSSHETTARVAGRDNGLEDTPAQSVTPNIDDEQDKS